MKIAFVHYHLKTGGVATVLRQQVTALQHVCDCLVLTGDRAMAQLPCEVLEISELGYDQPGACRTKAGRIADRVLNALKKKWPGGCDVLHIHNPLIAKNRQFLNIIKRLQQAGVNLFLQIHDFAEDGRPNVYFAEDYPVDCHYGVINARDKKILQNAGLEDAGLHALPNAIETLPCQERAERKRITLYPVRAIRRKNMGEAILLSLFFEKGRRLAITQPPNSPLDTVSYHDWLRWISLNRLPVDLEASTTVPFPQLVGAAESMVTTSIAEGFGFSFLEPWTAGKWLWGRRLDGVCADFEANGIQLDGLYDRIEIPLAWIDRDLYACSWRSAVVDAAARYAYPITTAAADQAFMRLIQSARIDFGLLNETLQRQVVTHLMTDPAARKTLVAMNPWLDNPGAVIGRSATIENNRQAVLTHYGLEPYRIRLLAIYDQVVGNRVRHRIDKAAVVEAFFDLDRFPLLKWGGYEP
jgi:hypothetical protein